MDSNRIILKATCWLTLGMFLILSALIAFPRIQLYLCHRKIEYVDARCNYLMRRIDKFDTLYRRTDRQIKFIKAQDKIQLKAWREVTNYPR